MAGWTEWSNGRNGGNGGWTEWSNGGNGQMAEMATYVLFTVHTDTDTDDDNNNDTLIFYSIEEGPTLGIDDSLHIVQSISN
jgi:hypothetical protein